MMWAFLDIRYLLAHSDELSQLSPLALVMLAIAYLMQLATVIGLLRSVIIIVARKLGSYSPAHYRYWPRVLPWRALYRAWQVCRKWYERIFVMGKRATGGFAGVLATLCLLFRPGKFHLGRPYALGIGLLQPIGITIKRHLFLLAMSGTGKTVALSSQIAMWRGSVFVIDPKAQAVRALCGLDGRQWFVIDPDGLSGIKSACFNVFDCIKEAMARDGEGAAVLWAMRVAEALVVTPDGARSPYFFDVARQVLAGQILHVLSAHPEDEHHLPFVRDLIVHGYRLFEDGQELTKDDEAHELLLRAMRDNPAFDGVIAGAVSAMQSASGETGGNVRSTLQEQTKVLDIPNLRAILKSSDFSLRWLKTRDDVALAFTPSIYSVREELSSFSRLLTNMTAYTFEAETNKKGQCLMVVDELPSQGYNPTLEVMLAVGRSMGLTFLGVSQNVELMQRHYPKSWKSFIGEADATFWMGGNHPDNAKMLSEILGKRTIIDKDRETGRKSYRDVAVMEAEQITRFLDPNSHHLIVTRAGARPLKLINDPYFKALPVWRYAPDPDHKETLLRRISRALFGRKPNTDTRRSQ